MALPVGETLKPPYAGFTFLPKALHGRYARLEPVAASHASGLFNSFARDQETLWTYLGYGPFATQTEFANWFADRLTSHDPWFFAIIDQGAAMAKGMASFMRADEKNGVIEIGHIWMAPSLQRTRTATETIYLMMRHAFDDLKVRRLEWKCDALNAPSRSAALRFGFRFEGVFRQHMIVKGRNRDTAWFAIIDKDWPEIQAGFERWLAPDNFDSQGLQKAKLQTR
jgi:RimJ/RimL family protein N-acetyltransferase